MRTEVKLSCDLCGNDIDMGRAEGQSPFARTWGVPSSTNSLESPFDKGGLRGLK